MKRQPSILGSPGPHGSPRAKRLRPWRLRRAGAFLAVVLLSACGQKGPLYLPTPEQSASAPSSSHPPSRHP